MHHIFNFYYTSFVHTHCGTSVEVREHLLLSLSSFSPSTMWDLESNQAWGLASSALTDWAIISVMGMCIKDSRLIPVNHALYIISCVKLVNSQLKVQTMKGKSTAVGSRAIQDLWDAEQWWQGVLQQSL